MYYKDFQNKSVLITGGTGSFGRSFAERILAKTAIKKLIVLSRDEFKQHHMEQEINDERVRFFLGDVRDLPRLKRAFNNVDIVVHAAALKQVPALEYNPTEAIKTNIEGSQNVIEAAIDNNVKKVLFVSTDKAVQPANLYGATKLCAEKLCVAANAYAPGKTRFSAVRYGNVVGSRGSIVETLINGNVKNTVTITHPDMTRFWISLEQAFDLVTFALREMEGGEIFIPRIPSMKIADLFDALAPQAKKEVVGLRPGEKMHEILLTQDESERALAVGEKCFVILPRQENEPTQGIHLKHKKKGVGLAPGFSYASDTNEEWLGVDDFKKIVESLRV